MLSTRRITMLIGMAAAAVLALPAAAAAVVYCVPDDTIHPSCDPDQDHPTIQAALGAAAGSAGVPDTVRIGPGTFTEDNLAYADGAGTNPVDIIGAGTGLTTLTVSDTTGPVDAISLDGFANSTVSALTVTLPANPDATADTGVRLNTEARAFDIVVDGPAASDAAGLSMGGATTLDDSSIDLPFAGSSTFGVRQGSGSPTITDTTIHAGSGVTHSGDGQTTTIDRSIIQASFKGVETDSGTIRISNSVVDLGANDSAVGLDANNNNASPLPKTVHADHVTIVGGGLNSIGFRVWALNPTTAQNSVGTLTNSVISGPATPISRQADNDGSPPMDSQAGVTVGYSNYDDSANVDLNGDHGAGAITVDPVGTQTNFPPGFVDSFHLGMSSPLLDIADPLDVAGTDIDGDPRGLSSASTCTAPDPGRRDVGADEFVASPLDCIAPDTFISGKRKVKSKKKRARVSFALASTEPGSSFECSLDAAPFAPCASPISAIVKRGAHTLTARSTDAAGNQDTTPASFSFKVTKKKPKKK